MLLRRLQNGTLCNMMYTVLLILHKSNDTEWIHPLNRYVHTIDRHININES